MNKLGSARLADFSAALVLAATLVHTPADAQETAWQKVASEAAGPLSTELSKAFPAIAQDGKANYVQFVTALKAAGLGKPQERPSAKPGGDGDGGGRGRRTGGPDGGIADVEFAASLDADRDGMVTMAELRGAVEADLRKAFERKASLDTNSDGSISKKEYATSMPPKFGEVDEYGMDGHARGHFKREDLDEDGELSIGEVTGPVISRSTARIRTMKLALRLADADTDHDKSLSVEELQASVAGVVDKGESPWKALVFAGDAIPVESLYRSLSRLSPGDAMKLDRSLRQ